MSKKAAPGDGKLGYLELRTSDLIAIYESLTLAAGLASDHSRRERIKSAAFKIGRALGMVKGKKESIN